MEHGRSQYLEVRILEDVLLNFILITVVLLLRERRDSVGFLAIPEVQGSECVSVPCCQM